MNKVAVEQGARDPQAKILQESFDWKDNPAIQKLLGTIQLEPISEKESDFHYIISDGEKEFKPYYIAHTKIQTLALLDDRDKGSNWSQLWAQ